LATAQGGSAKGLQLAYTFNILKNKVIINIDPATFGIRVGMLLLGRLADLLAEVWAIAVSIFRPVLQGKAENRRRATTLIFSKSIAMCWYPQISANLHHAFEEPITFGKKLRPPHKVSGNHLD
jgi:hypothetical protein